MTRMGLKRFAVVFAVLAGTLAGAVTATAATPSNTSPPTITGTPQKGQTLTAHHGTWSGTTPISYAYQWRRCDNVGGSCADIDNAKSQTYTATSVDVGNTLRVRVTATNAEGSSSASSNATAVIKPAPNNAPVNTSPPTISGSAGVGQALTAANGTWSGATPMSFAYQWRRCDQNGANCADISGANSQSYTLVSVDQGNTLRVVVTAKNSAGSSPATSVPTAVVAAPASGTVTMDSNRSIVVYGQSVRLFGTVAGGQVGESVSIIARPFGPAGLSPPVATATTTATGSYDVAARPSIHTVYYAKLPDGTRSDSLAVSVQPRVTLTRIAAHTLVVRVYAARSYVGHYGLVQRWNGSFWVSMKRVFLTSRVTIGPTVQSRATFHLFIRHGLRLRVFLPLGQRAPGYLSGSSNVALS